VRPRFGFRSVICRREMPDLPWSPHCMISLKLDPMVDAGDETLTFIAQTPIADIVRLVTPGMLTAQIGPAARQYPAGRPLTSCPQCRCSTPATRALLPKCPYPLA
jgi:hypothetical protein